MNVREWINNNPSVMTAAALVVMVLALSALFWQATSGGPTGPRDAFYFDLDADELFVAVGTELPPIETPGGGTRGVRAHVYACGDCPSGLAGLNRAELENRGAFIAWLERYPAEAKRLIEEYRERSADEPPDPDYEMRVFEAEDRGPLIGRPGDDRWVTLDSEAAMTLMELPTRRCDQARAVRCMP